MIQSTLPLLCAVLLAAPAPGANTSGTPGDSRQKEAKKNAKPATQATSLTGCIDERETGHYILIDDTKLSPLAELQAEGFPNEGFAKYLGQKVTVQGKSSTEGTRTLFTVRKVETVSETCTPSRPPQ
jgi:hypothetical protein